MSRCKLMDIEVQQLVVVRRGASTRILTLDLSYNDIAHNDTIAALPMLRRSKINDSDLDISVTNTGPKGI